jgi:hypothetical protein
MPWYTSVEGDSMLSLPNGSLYLTEGHVALTPGEGRGVFTLEYRAHGGCVIQSWNINVPSLYEARRLSMDMVRNYLLSEVKYLETTNPTVGVNYECRMAATAKECRMAATLGECSTPTYSGCGKVRVGCSVCKVPENTPCKCKRVYNNTPSTVGGYCVQ